MGGRESTTRKVSFGLDEEEKVTVLQGIKLSEDVLQRMRDPEPAPAPGIKPPKPESRKPDSPGHPPGPSAAQMQEELRRRFEQQQAMVQEELARMARRERDAGDENVSAALLRERNKTREEQEKAHSLPAELDAWAKQLDKKEAELQQLSAFYKEQLLLLEKKNMDIYQEAADQYNQAASKAEAHIKPRHVVPICPGLQSDVLSCYKENKHQTLLCSSLAKEYMNCINTAKKNTMVNHG